MIARILPNQQVKLLESHQIGDNLKSRSAWRKLRVTIPADQLPHAIGLRKNYRTELRRLDCCTPNITVILRDEGVYVRVVVDEDRYDLFLDPALVEVDSFPHPVTNSGDSDLGETTSAQSPVVSKFLEETSSPSPPSPLLPFVPTKTEKCVVSSETTRGCGNEIRENCLLKKRTVNSGKPGAVVPVNLTEKDLQDLGDKVELAYLVMHQINHFRWRSRLDRDAFVDLSSESMDDLLGGKWKVWPAVRDLMLATGIMERTTVKPYEDEFGIGLEHCDLRGAPGKAAYGYRLRHDLRHAPNRQVILTDPLAIAYMVKLKGKLNATQRWLESKLPLVTMAPVPEDVLYRIAEADTETPITTITGRVQAYRDAIDAITSQSHTFKADDFSGRLHTPITRLKRELRPYLRVNGQPLAEIDVKCCQPLLVGHLAKKAGYADDTYIRLCEQDVYQYIADKLNLTRKAVKQQFPQAGLFASNGSDHQKTPVMRFIKSEFPVIWDYITTTKSGKKTKANPKPHSKLARLAQSAEVKIIIGTVCDRIRKDRYDTTLLTIHDAILMLREDAGYVTTQLQNAFAELGLSPRLETTNV